MNIWLFSVEIWSPMKRLILFFYKSSISKERIKIALFLLQMKRRRNTMMSLSSVLATIVMQISTW